MADTDFVQATTHKSASVLALSSQPAFDRSAPDDTRFYREAFGIFLRQEGRSSTTPFLDLTRQEQSVVVLLSQKLKQEAQK